MYVLKLYVSQSLLQQIIAEVGTVVEARVPKKPRFSQPLQNAEITEGQRSVTLKHNVYRDALYLYMHNNSALIKTS